RPVPVPHPAGTLRERPTRRGSSFYSERCVPTEPRTPALSPHLKGGGMLATCKALGHIDTATAPSFNAELHDVIDNADESFVNVDCSGLTFIDSAGYHVLVDATNYAIHRGHTLVIRNLSPSCRMLLSLFDEDLELHVEPCRHSIHRPEIGGCASARLVST